MYKNFIIKSLFLLGALSMPSLVLAQDCTLAQYQKLLKEADAAAQKGEYDLAINKLQSAKTCQPARAEEVDKKILTVFNEVNSQKKKAEQNAKEALRQKELAQKSAREADIQRKQAEAQRDSTNAQRKLADQEKNNAKRQARAAENLALIGMARDSNPTFALQAAYYNWQKHPENNNAAVGFAQLYGDTMLGFYDEMKKYHRGYVLKLGMAKQGTKLLSVGEHGNVEIRDLLKDTVTNLFRGSGSTTGTAIAPDGKSIVMGDFQRSPFFWNEETGHSGIPGASSNGEGMAFSQDSRFLAISDEAGTILIFSSPDLKVKQRLKGHTGRISALAFSPDGKQLLSGSGDRTVILWDIESGLALYTMKGHANHPKTVAFSPNGKQAASGSFDSTVRVWDLQTGKLITILEAHKLPVIEVAYSPDGAFLLTAGGDGQAILWDATTLKMKKRCIGHGGPVSSIVFTPDSKMFYTGGRDGTIRTWHITQEPLRIYDTEGDACFSPDSRYLLLSNVKNVAEIRQVNDNALAWKLDHLYSRSPVAFAPDNNSVWIGVSLWNVKTGKENHEFYLGALDKVALSPDGKKVLMIRDSDRPVLAELGTKKVLHDFQEFKGSARSGGFSKNGQRLMIAGRDGGNSGAILVWDVSKSSIVNQITIPGRHIMSAALSPDGNSVVIGCDGGDLQVVDVTTGTAIKQFLRQTSLVYNVDFSPDGKSILSENLNGQTTEWNLDTQLPLQKIHHGSRPTYAPDGNWIMTFGRYQDEKKYIRIWPTYKWLLQHQIYQYSLLQLREKGVRLEIEDLMQLWEDRTKLTSEELKLIGKTAHKS